MGKTAKNFMENESVTQSNNIPSFFFIITLFVTLKKQKWNKH